MAGDELPLLMFETRPADQAGVKYANAALAEGLIHVLTQRGGFGRPSNIEYAAELAAKAKNGIRRGIERLAGEGSFQDRVAKHKAIIEHAKRMRAAAARTPPAFGPRDLPPSAGGLPGYLS